MLRTRARSACGSRSTARPFSQYRPVVGDSSSARIARNVDLPQPDGPETETYSPRPMSTVTSLRALGLLVRLSPERLADALEANERQ